jgi:O-antigen ligase
MSEALRGPSGDRLPAAFAAMLIALPFVHVGTVRAGVRLIPADLLAMWVAAQVACDNRSLRAILVHPPSALASLCALLMIATALVSAALGLYLETARNPDPLELSVLVGWQGTPRQRAALETLRLGQCAAALIGTLALVRTSLRFDRACRWYVAGGSLAALYAVYAWVGVVGQLDWPLLPGTFANPYSMRTGGTFPEPVALGGFMLTSLVATLWLGLRPEDRTVGWWLLLMLQVVGLLSALSTLAFIGLLAIVLTLLGTGLARSAGRVAGIAAMALLIVLMLVPPKMVAQQTFEKFAATAPSWQDRTAGWRSALSMARAYPVLGVGIGQYAYAQPRFYPTDTPTGFRGARANSAMLEVLAESGLIGGALVTVIVIAVVWSLRRSRSRALPEVRASWAGVAVIVVLAAGYYTSRFAFEWVFLGLLIARGATSGSAAFASASRDPEAE